MENFPIAKLFHQGLKGLNNFQTNVIVTNYLFFGKVSRFNNHQIWFNFQKLKQLE